MTPFSSRGPFADHHQANPTSGVLTYARERRLDGEDFGTVLWRINNGGVSGYPGEFEHAHCVLSRLAKLDRGC